MKTLAVRQPFATLIAEGEKTIEVRTWKTEFRGPVLIVASGKPYRLENDDGSVEYLKTRCQVCIVDLVEIRNFNPSDVDAACLDDFDEAPWEGHEDGEDTGIYAWIIANPRHVWPKQHTGKLNLYETPDTNIFLLPADAHYLDVSEPSDCIKCGHPPGPDWLDEATTCPRCKLVQPA